jgi:putative zinc finger protein
MNEGDVPGVAARTVCPDAELLAAYVDGWATVEDRRVIEAHLAGCADCRELVGAAVEMVRGEAEMPSRRPRRTAWFVAGAGLIAAAAAIVVVVRTPRSDANLYVPEMADLVAAVGGSRLVEPRLTGGFAYGPPPPVTRGAGGEPPLSVLSAAALIERRARGGSPEAQAALGVSEVLLGRSTAAQSLERACAARPADGRCHSDLAAAYLVDGRTRTDRSALSRALNAAQQATQLDSHLAEAWFNRALAFESLDRFAEARGAWDDYLRVDSTSPWAAEARRHRDRLGSSTR